MINSNSRSPSPMSIRQNSNPNPNPNSKINQERELLGVRNSFSFAKSSITTPANSPAEFLRRCSFGKEGGISLQDHEKENERDPNLKPVARLRSPSVSKMTKNFMSPTISAVSKINPSPRKKVLGERNDAIRSSASLSEGKFHFYSMGSLDFSDQNEPKEGMVDEFFNKEHEKKVTECSHGVRKLELDSDLVVLSPEVPINDAKSYETIPQKCDMPNAVFENNVGFNAKVATIASLDADPSLPPYDPETNFLSPRPRFLHYKPKPRIESYINQGVRFEDDFSSESFSESEISEEVQSEETSSIGSSLEEKASIWSSLEAKPSIGASLEEEKPSFSEPISPKSQQLEERVEHKLKARPWFGGMWKAVCLICFVIVLGFTVMYKGDFTEDKINGLLSNLIFKPIEVKFSALSFDNLTAWQEKEVEDSLFRDSMLWREDFALSPPNSGEEIESMCLNDYDENDQLIQEFVEENYFSEVEMIDEEETSFSDVENQEAEYGVISEVQDEFQIDFKADDQSLSSLPQDSEVHPQFTTENDQIVEVQGEIELDFKAKDQVLSSLPEEPEEPQVTNGNDLVTEVSEGLTPIPEATRKRSLTPSIVGAILFVVSLLAAITFMFVKKSGKLTSITEKDNSTQFIAESKIESKVQENQTSRSDLVEVDMIGESYPSDLSSFPEMSSYNLKDRHEAQSVETSSKRNYKRESLASSSSEYTMNTSYGSFTTYTTLHSKQRDDEVVTPVRRSSRIRSKVTSP